MPSEFEISSFGGREDLVEELLHDLWVVDLSENIDQFFVFFHWRCLSGLLYRLARRRLRVKRFAPAGRIKGVIREKLCRNSIIVLEI